MNMHLIDLDYQIVIFLYVFFHNHLCLMHHTTNTILHQKNIYIEGMYSLPNLNIVQKQKMSSTYIQYVH